MVARDAQYCGPLAADSPDTAVLPDVDQRVRRLPPYKVILHNDDVNEFGEVILVILKLTSIGEQHAVLCTIEAHETGHSMLLVTNRERAELYVEQFASCRITVTCEPDN